MHKLAYNNKAMLITVTVLSILLVPSLADAWGPLTHVYLGYQVLDAGAALIPAGIYAILKKFRQDFLYGNLSADIIMGRRFQDLKENSHDWHVAWDLLDAAHTDRMKAFAYGYILHLCSDSVVHNVEKSRVPFSHSLLEIKSDSIIDKKYRRILRRLDKTMQKRNDRTLENALDSMFFSFKTNKRIFKSLLLLSRLPNYTPFSNFIDHRFPYDISLMDIYTYHEESIRRMIDLLANGKDSPVLNEHPMGRHIKKAS